MTTLEKNITLIYLNGFLKTTFTSLYQASLNRSMPNMTVIRNDGNIISLVHHVIIRLKVKQILIYSLAARQELILYLVQKY